MKKGDKRGKKSFIINNKKGQVTIFIILAIVIVVLGILFYAFFPEIKTTFGLETDNPNAFLKTCLEGDILKTVEKVSFQGGSLNPELSYSYFGNEVEYLCYTNQYYEKCVMQQPMLKEHVESEIKSGIQEQVASCLNDLKKSFESQGYDVSMKQGDFNIELLPQRIMLTSETSLSLKKQETKTYNSLSISVNNNLYELTSIALSMLNWEARYGDAEITTYMNYYPTLKVEKFKQSEGTTIYVLTERATGNKFQFASRSIVWPPGY